jgi:hypothetical protein
MHTYLFSSADMQGSIDFLAHPHFLFVKSCKPTLYETLVGIEDDDAVDNLSAMLNYYRLQECLIDSYTQIRRFSKAIDTALTRPSAALDSIAFVEDTYQIQYQLILLSSTPVIDMETQCLEEALRMAGLLYMKETLREYPLAVLGSINLVRRLKEALVEISENERFGPMLMWLFFMGAIPSKKGQDRAWFTAQLVKLAMKMGIDTWEEVKSVLQSVVFIDRIHGEACKGLWEEIEVIKGVLTSTRYVTY